jgi:hypothetical protein
MKNLIRPRILLLIVAMVVLTMPGVSNGQTTPQVPSPKRADLTRVAYSADQITETTQVLADGTTINLRKLTKVYRDSRGRLRYENFGPATESPEGWNQVPFDITIIDEAAGVTYDLNPRDHTARKDDSVAKQRASRAAGEPQNPGAAAQATRPQRQFSRESLGKQTIEGFEAEGIRVTVTFPVGTFGNDRPTQRVSERWFSRELGQVLLDNTTDPHAGESVQRLTNIVREEQPPELFEVPPDYTIVQEQTVRPALQPPQ